MTSLASGESIGLPRSRSTRTLGPAMTEAAVAPSATMATGLIARHAVKDHVAAVSCGIYEGGPILDLDYTEDSGAGTDANFVLTGAGGIVEIQGTAEGVPFSEEELSRLLALARKGTTELVQLQKDVLKL